MKKTFLLLLFLSIVTFPTLAQQYQGNQEDIDIILVNIDKFSSYYMNAAYERLANAYSSDAKVLPPGADIIEGRAAIKKRWVLPEGVSVPHHKINPVEIKIIGNYAYDMGYYEGKTRRPDGDVVPWKGKYLIVWKKEANDWKIYMDAWNRIDDQASPRYLPFHGSGLLPAL